MSLSSASSAILAQADMIPEDSGGPYVIAAYVVFLVLVAIYVAIMAQRLTKVSRTADELEARLDALEHNHAQGAGVVQDGDDVHGESMRDGAAA